MRFEGKTVFITGAGAGIGRATAERCADEGATVVVTDVDREGGEETVERIADAGGEATFHELDVSDADAFEDCVDTVVDEHGLDVVVNNAGIGHAPAAVEETDTRTFERVLDVNLRGVWNGCHAALPVLKAQESGAIVNVGSLASLLGLPKQSVYSLTKGAVLNFTRAVAAEAGPHDVRANAVCPGFTDTQLGQQYFASQGDPEKAIERMTAQYPLRRLGEPEEVAGCIAFLASEDASYVTGQGLVVDGGYSAW
ncbi:SDR family NAD(P)-dependent oxidoreductase [Halococcus hamelinensis]|uniref:Dehydrogenase/ reductase 4 n=1 Tax=Halococcus hamelinensis 100A6 TaxID=1132509 RepID=M0M6E2_9EURY|nr:SDR family NAD(P)-dependent oxidoreductase [Halococcus hamelinensis]EMA39940.1 dehydrogenase/ reductase 4 [Halococcus hamelinensis 100A6]